MAVAIPDDVQAMLKGKHFWHLATIGPSGAPQSTPIWADTDGTNVIVNTALGRAKDRNMRADGRVALSSFDFSNPYGFVEIQGKVVEIVDGQPVASRMLIPMKFTIYRSNGKHLRTTVDRSAEPLDADTQSAFANLNLDETRGVSIGNASGLELLSDTTRS